jgi:hypothetical protein
MQAAAPGIGVVWVRSVFFFPRFASFLPCVSHVHTESVTRHTHHRGVAGLGANLSEDALYPTSYVDDNGTALTDAHSYVLRFANNSTPPVNAFWSVTMYDGQAYPVPNPLDQHTISPHLSNLTYNPDGSLDIYIQKRVSRC